MSDKKMRFIGTVAIILIVISAMLLVVVIARSENARHLLRDEQKTECRAKMIRSPHHYLLSEAITICEQGADVHKACLETRCIPKKTCP